MFCKKNNNNNFAIECKCFVSDRNTSARKRKCFMNKRNSEENTNVLLKMLTLL